MQPISAPARAIFGTTPEVESVMRRLEMREPLAVGDDAMRVAHRLEIVERLAHAHHHDVGDQPVAFGRQSLRLARARAPRKSPSRSRATITWPTISPAVRLRTRRCVPVWQNEQLSVQPTWLETQSVPRSASGM